MKIGNVNNNTEIDENELRICGSLLKQHGLQLACAESMTAGFLSTLWAMEVCSGSYFLGSIVCYDDTTKNNLLHVSLAKIKKYCAESAVITLRMLSGLRAVMSHAHVCISITGLAFKTKNPHQRRAIGTVYYAFSYANSSKIYKRNFSGNSATILIATCNALLQDFRKWLEHLIAIEKIPAHIHPHKSKTVKTD